jgi:uncharacterized membrane protein YeaQ/YmgE (transglycosylase-associated protein family)
MTAYTESTHKPLTMDLGLTGKLVVGGTVSTGLLLGGYTVALMTLAGRMNGNAVLLTSVGLFVIGALVGLTVSAVAGLAGRDEGLSMTQAGHQVAMGILYAIPATIIGAMISGWIAMSVVAVYLDRPTPMIGSAVAALIGAVVIVGTVRLTWETAVNTARRVRQTI